MAKPKIARIVIRPVKGGGHHVTHEFAPAAKYSAGGRSGGMSMDEPPPVEQNFAPGEHNALLNHIASALALKGIAQQRPAATGGGGLGGVLPGGPGA